jgi:putative Mn2+ efflux pump MntP
VLTWFESLFTGLPPLVGFIVTGSFPIITVGAGIGAIRAAWQHRRDRAAFLGSLALTGLAATMLWSGVMFSQTP